MFNQIFDKITKNQFISRNDAAWLFKNAKDAELMELAQKSRAKFHSPTEASYLIMGIINFTNICVAKCDYCSFYKLPHQAGGYLLSYEQIKSRLEGLVKLGGSMVGFNNGFHPKFTLENYAALFKQIKTDFPDITFYAMTVAEFIFVCRLAKLSYEEGANYLKTAGVEWVTGGGAEVLDEEFRNKHSPGKFKVKEYFKAQKAILDSGLGSTATMVIGFDETLDQRLNHLEALRSFQEETGRRLISFLCWTYKPYNNELGGTEIPSPEYLRWIAVCRIYLSNFTNIRTSILTQNENAFLGLLYGANDFDLPTEDEVTEKAGATINLDFQRLLERCKTLGYMPIHRKPFELPQQKATPLFSMSAVHDSKNNGVIL